MTRAQTPVATAALSSTALDTKPALRRWDVTGKMKCECVEHTLPALPADRVHLEFVCNGVCGSDTHMFRTGAVHSGHKGPHQPLTLGHELVGRVLAVGSDVTTLKAGDMVAVEPGLPCGTCPNCLKGRYHCCPKTLYMGTPPQNGGLADEFHWPATWCHLLPPSLAADPVLASLAEPVAACRQSWELRNKLVDRADDEWTVVTGSGPMALGVVAVIKAMNPNEKVAVVARNAKALAFAKEFGADATFELSSINPTAVANDLAEELGELFKTDHFDNDETLDASFADSKVRLAAARAAREAVRVQRDRGSHMDEIQSIIKTAAFAAAVKAQIEENKAVFGAVQKMANGFVSSLFECTGDERLLETIIESRCMLANGAIIGLGCHYGVSFDVAMLRRFELSFQPVRRSCNQFPATIKLLDEQPDMFRKLVGGTVKFADFGGLMTGDVKETATGTGGPKTVVVK
jgi:L-iditol 2-dehydrogenase